jgi:hypothetical protein
MKLMIGKKNLRVTKLHQQYIENGGTVLDENFMPYRKGRYKAKEFDNLDVPHNKSSIY